MNKHDSMRGWFAYELYNQMKKNKDIILLVGDLGYGVWDSVRDEMPKQFVNTGAAEQTLLDIACGMAVQGKKPFVYSITSFLIYRPFETLRTYINHERIPVRLIGSGRDKDYLHDGFSHYAHDLRQFVGRFRGINKLWPETKEEIPALVEQMVIEDKSWFISLKR